MRAGIERFLPGMFPAVPGHKSGPITGPSRAPTGARHLNFLRTSGVSALPAPPFSEPKLVYSGPLRKSPGVDIIFESGAIGRAGMKKRAKSLLPPSRFLLVQGMIPGEQNESL